MSRVIGINTLFLLPNHVGGTENYTRLSLDGLQTYDHDDQYIVFCNEENYHTFTFISPHFQKVRCQVHATNRLARMLYEQLFFPFLLQMYHCDIVHSFGYVGPILSFSKRVVTVHDANWKDHPEDITATSKVIQSILMAAVLRTTHAIIVDSTFSLSRLSHYYPHFKGKMVVISPWVGERLIQLLQRKLSHPLRGGKYALCVSGFYPHKKISYLLRVIDKVDLVLIGKNGLDEKKIVTAIKHMANVHYFPKVSLPKLAAYYQHASVFVFPSIYEGYGYPVYEAMAAGLPLIVGKKELYEPRLAKTISELTFDVKKDSFLIEEKLKARKQIIRDSHSAKKSILALLKLYATV